MTRTLTVAAILIVASTLLPRAAFSQFPINANDMRQAFEPVMPIVDDPLFVTGPLVPPQQLDAEDAVVGVFPAGFQFRAAGMAIVDSIYDTGFVGSGTRFFTSSVALDGTDAARRRGRFQMSGTTSRVVFDFKSPSTTAPEALAEVDFVDGGVRLRNVAGVMTFGPRDAQIMGGQFWSTFGDEYAKPMSIINDGTAAGAVFRRQAQLRYTEKRGDALAFSVAVENPNSSDFALITPPVPPASGDERLQRWPDLVTHVRLETCYVKAQLAALVRGMGFEDTMGVEHHATGWGFSGTARIYLPDLRDNVRFGFVGGQGLGQYIFGFAGETDLTAAGPDPSGGFSAVRNLGGYIGYQHFFNNSVQTNLGYGIAHADTFATMPGGVPRETQNVWGNLILALRDNLFLGMEYHYGFLRTNAATEGDNHRIQVSLSYIPED